MKALTAKELLEQEKQIDKRCVEFATWLCDGYYTNPKWEYKNIYDLLEMFKEEKFKGSINK